jgi:hypothetical protein
MSGHYFHQDLVVAQKIFEAQSRRHVDVGSRIDGFVAHVATFRPIEIMDIRVVKSKVPNISFLQGDLMKPSDIRSDSLSCLHKIEHFGLGKYGGPIDPQGHLKGFENLVDMLEKGGTLEISFPIFHLPCYLQQTTIDVCCTSCPKALFLALPKLHIWF